MTWWKLQREATRLWHQICSIPAYFFEYLKQKEYDRKFFQQLTVFSGQEINSNRYALILSYQPKSFSQSSLFTCQHLTALGFRVLLVSNAALSEDDLQQLQPVCWKVVIRPNFGYDFGGYRDGIRLLHHWSVEPDQLLILNDSIWYPIYTDDRLIHAASKSQADLVGAVQLHKINNPNTVFYESYFYSFTKNLFLSDAFKKFWHAYRLSDIKYRAVKSGERGFSKKMLASGISHDGIFTKQKLLILIGTQDHQFLYNTLLYAAYVDAAFLQQNEKLLGSFSASEEWRKLALAHIHVVANRRHFHATFCYASILLLGAGFLKKSDAPIHIAMRRQFVRAVVAGDLPMPSCAAMLEEIKLRDSSIK